MFPFTKYNGSSKLTPIPFELDVMPFVVSDLTSNLNVAFFDNVLVS